MAYEIALAGLLRRRAPRPTIRAYALHTRVGLPARYDPSGR